MNGPDNPIGWCDYTWNPVTGCKRDCTFQTECMAPRARCYAKAIATRFAGSKAWPNGFEPTFHPKRLAEPSRVPKPSRIFVCSMGDLFGPWVDVAWIHAVLDVVRECDWHTFQFLTKYPENAALVDFPANAWAGTTVVGSTVTAIMADMDRRLDLLRKFRAPVRFLSCEPLCGPVDVALADPDWIIVGAASGPGGFQPQEVWVRAIDSYARRHNVPVYHKDGLHCRQTVARLVQFPDSPTHARAEAASGA